MMRNAALLASAALFAVPASAQQQPISPMAGGRVMPTQPLPTTTGATAASRMKPGSALELGPMRPMMNGGLVADDRTATDDPLGSRATDSADANPNAAKLKTAKKKPAAALGAALATDDPAAATAASGRIPDIDSSPGDSRPTRVIVRRPTPATANGKAKTTTATPR